MTKDQEKISNVLDYFTRILEEKTFDFQQTKEMYGIETRAGKDRIIFYLLKCKEFDDKCLLEYINSQNIRLLRQREELIDLSVKIAGLNHGGDNETAMEEVIKNYKLGLPSGEGLRDIINMIKERYRWSPSKVISMNFRQSDDLSHGDWSVCVRSHNGYHLQL